MKKKISIVLVILLVMAAALSVKAHAAESNQRVIDDQTGISITDITPREENEDETKDYKVSSYYPIEVKTAKGSDPERYCLRGFGHPSPGPAGECGTQDHFPDPDHGFRDGQVG